MQSLDEFLGTRNEGYEQYREEKEYLKRTLQGSADAFTTPGTRRVLENAITACQAVLDNPDSPEAIRTRIEKSGMPRPGKDRLIREQKEVLDDRSAKEYARYASCVLDLPWVAYDEMSITGPHLREKLDGMYLSQVFFVTTANAPNLISPPLLDRMDVIELEGYSEEDKFDIAVRHLVGGQIERNGLAEDRVEFEDGAIRILIRDYTSEVGVRGLDRQIGIMCGKVAEDWAMGNTSSVKVTETMVRERLGEPTVDGESLRGIERLRGAVSAKGMPRTVRSQGRRELERLSTLSPWNSEFDRSLNYLRWLVDLPWRVCKEVTIDLSRAEVVLDQGHCGLDGAKKRILEYLAVRKRKPDAKGAILCFVGPPGVGKTSLARAIANSLGLEFAWISCSGMGDETELRGHNRTWLGAQPGRIIREFRCAKSRNPVFVLDEIDKLGHARGKGGDPAAALLEVLDPAQNHMFVDQYIEVPFDLSQVFFVATANVRNLIPVPLLDRLEVIELEGYSEEEKFEIAREHLVTKQVEGNGLTDQQIEFDDDAIWALIRDYTSDMGVRSLERQIEAVCRKLAFALEKEGVAPPTITEDAVRVWLGEPAGESEGVRGVEQIRRAVNGRGMPPSVRSQGRRELERLSMRSPGDPEFSPAASTICSGWSAFPGLGPVNTIGRFVISLAGWSSPRRSTHASSPASRDSVAMSACPICRCSTRSCTSPSRGASGEGCRSALGTGTRSTPV